MPLSLPGGISVIRYLQASMLPYFLQGFKILQNCGSEMLIPAKIHYSHYRESSSDFLCSTELTWKTLCLYAE